MSGALNHAAQPLMPTAWTKVSVPSASPTAGSATDLDSFRGKYVLVVTTAKTYFRAGATATAAASVTGTADGYIPADTHVPFYVPEDNSRRYVAFMAGSGATATLLIGAS